MVAQWQWGQCHANDLAAMKYAVALSGGADSLCTAALMPPGQAFIVDHGLRPESATEARMAAAKASALGHQPHIIPLTWGSVPHTQAHYRRARYRALALACQRYGIDQLWTGHHRDDQGETVMMRMEQGSGLLGLSGMPYASAFACARLIRPLLTTGREDIERWLRDKGIDWSLDPANGDPRYPRTHARVLLRQNPALARRLIDVSAAMGQLRGEITAQIDAGLIVVAAPGLLTVSRQRVQGLGDAALAEVLRICVQWIGGQAYPAIADHLALARQGRAGQRSTGGGTVMEAGAVFRFAPESRQARGLSMEDLARRAAPNRLAQTKASLWLPEGARQLPFVNQSPQLGGAYISDKTPRPLEDPQWIEVLRSLPM